MVDLKIAKERLSNFQKVAGQIKKDYREKLINSTATVLFENQTKNKWVILVETNTSIL